MRARILPKVFVVVVSSLIILSYVRLAQAPILNPGDLVWERTHSAVSGSSRGYGLAQAPDGGYVLTGPYGNGSAIWLVKTNDKGNVEWDYKFTGTSCDGRDVEVVADGYVIAGTSYASPSDPKRARLIKVSTDGNDVLIDATLAEGDPADGTKHTIGYNVEPVSDGYVMTGIYYPDEYNLRLVWLIKRT